MKSKLAQKEDEFLESEEGKYLCGGSANGQYLKNRIVRAFHAGITVGLQQADTPNCVHEWVDGGEQVIEDALFCPHCRAVRSR